MDLAGKTTATKNFIRRTGREWEIRRNSIVPDNPIYLLADSLRRADAYDAEVLGNLYIAALMADIRSFSWPERDAIQDSTIILRSLAFLQYSPASDPLYDRGLQLSPLILYHRPLFIITPVLVFKGFNLFYFPYCASCAVYIQPDLQKLLSPAFSNNQ